MMKKMTTIKSKNLDKKKVFLGCAFAAMVSFPSNVAAQTRTQSTGTNIVPATGTFQTSKYDVFKPKIKTSNATLDYSIWDEALESVVLRLGRSIRIRARKPQATVGTRFVSGHQTAYRMEGSRVTFSYMDDDFETNLSGYKNDLVKIANDVDITKLGRDEQLAFWFNLHNVTVIEQILQNYPSRRPSRLRVGPEKQLLHDAKIIRIRGVALSLRDIRQNIVYANWNNKNVIYGFFHGDIGGPAIQNYAITGENVQQVLDYQAGEFVNSLRGFHTNSKARKVSRIYDEAKPYYFTNFEQDLHAHLVKNADAEIIEELAENKPFEYDRYNEIVADLVGGSMPMPSYVSRSTDENFLSVTMPPEVIRLLRELDDKKIKMRRRGMFNNRGTVIIEDLGKVDETAPVIVDENEEGSLVE